MAGQNIDTVYFEDFYRGLYQYILKRLGLETNTAEGNILELARMSLRKQYQGTAIKEVQLMHSFSKTDCRRTNSIVKKKTLLIMHLEKKLGVQLDDVVSTELDTVEELARALYTLWYEVGNTNMEWMRKAE